jgi:tetratricopeptide (TPR) repeat protein/TolB-like protein
VLPFENLAGDAENQSLCDGLEETVTSLATSAGASRDLLVVPATEIRRGQVRTIAQARTQFRADLVITGAVQKTADRMRLTLNLADTRAVRQLDSRLISVAKSDAASLQDKLAEETGRLLGSGRPRSPSTKSPGDTTANSLAYSLYLEGAGEVDKRNANAAIEPLKKALQADPEFSLARAKLAEAYLWQNNFTSDPKWLALADEEVSRAAKSGENRETLMAQAMIRKATGDYPAAIALFRRLLSAEPANIEAYQLLAQTLQAANRITEAGEVLQQAVHLRPGYWPIRNTLGLFYMSQKNYRTAEQEFLSAAALAPGVPVIQSNLGALYFMMSRWPEAAASFERSLAIAPTAIGHSNLGTIYFYLGRYEDAAKEAKAATVLQPANSINWGNLGDAEWQIDGHRPQALEAFGQAVHLAEQQLQLNASNTKIRRNYALSLAKLGRPREAVSQIEMASSQAPSDPDVQFYAARVYAVTGATDRALAALSACRTLGCPQQEIEREPDLAALAKRSSK